MPLVYALNAIRVVSPCWSCEGHLGPDGQLYRGPSVWFTVSCVDVLGWLAECLAGFGPGSSLQAPWQVTAIDCGERRNAVFSLQPTLTRQMASGASGLAELHGEARHIADALLTQMGPLADRRLAAL